MPGEGGKDRAVMRGQSPLPVPLRSNVTVSAGSLWDISAVLYLPKPQSWSCSHPKAPTCLEEQVFGEEGMKLGAAGSSQKQLEVLLPPDVEL